MLSQDQIRDSGTGVSRRVALRKIGTIGVGATMTAGIFEMFGVGKARAATTAAPMSILAAAYAGQVVLPAVADPAETASCQCTTLCVRDEHTCGMPNCGTGNCCFSCDGCGINGSICLDITCDNPGATYCGPVL
jgi:hypothetical protein